MYVPNGRTQLYERRLVYYIVYYVSYYICSFSFYSNKLSKNITVYKKRIINYDFTKKRQLAAKRKLNISVCGDRKNRGNQTVSYARPHHWPYIQQIGNEDFKVEIIYLSCPHGEGELTTPLSAALPSSSAALPSSSVASSPQGQLKLLSPLQLPQSLFPLY